MFIHLHADVIISDLLLYAEFFVRQHSIVFVRVDHRKSCHTWKVDHYLNNSFNRNPSNIAL